MWFLVRKEYEQMTYTVARTPRVCLSSITFCFSLSANETRLLHYSHSGIDYIDCGRSIMAQWMGANTKRRHGRSNHHDLLLAHMKYLLLVFQLVWLIKKKKQESWDAQNTEIIHFEYFRVTDIEGDARKKAPHIASSNSRRCVSQWNI